ncbi:hypothetical protein CVV68_06840 [Arthrobacter livingstonensis]|uniref:Uncharacterized protein n=1 Tax=Arthrobacter livingstonensis TaxID=670078 RepID=A0A2V5LC95_9MICC|nr:hypothetical protein CVV68_06840 [Arthrobacter livingstonensis]
MCRWGSRIRGGCSSTAFVTDAARLLGVTKSTFIADSARQAAQKAIARSYVMVRAPEVFDSMMASLLAPDESAARDGLSGVAASSPAGGIIVPHDQADDRIRSRTL